MACLRYCEWLVGWLLREREREKSQTNKNRSSKTCKKTGLESESVDGTTTVERYNDLHTQISGYHGISLFTWDSSFDKKKLGCSRGNRPFPSPPSRHNASSASVAFPYGVKSNSSRLNGG